MKLDAVKRRSLIQNHVESGRNLQSGRNRCQQAPDFVDVKCGLDARSQILLEKCDHVGDERPKIVQDVQGTIGDRDSFLYL